MRVGLVGTGSWARSAHAPLLTGGPETELVGVWGRRYEAAEALAAAHGTRAFASLDDLIAASEAVAFAVPPDVQAVLAPRAAAAGRHLLLDKPLALDVSGAERIADAVGSARVGSLVLLTNRFARGPRAFLAETATTRGVAARASFLADVLLTTPRDLSPWRHEHGALLDIGPHTIDMLDAAVGPVVPGSVRAVGDSASWVALILEHANGAVSDVALSLASRPATGLNVDVHTPDRVISLASFRAGGDDVADTLGNVRRDFAAIVAGTPHPCDAAHGLRLQRLIAEAVCAIASQ